MRTLLLLLLLVTSQLALAQQRRIPPAPEGWAHATGVEFARVPITGGEQHPLLLDLYHPRSGPALPLLVYVHGGGWAKGTRQALYRRVPALLASRRYAIATIEYRTSNQAVWPAQIHDCKGAIRWLRAHAARYRIDPRRVAAFGTSAGGHLVAMLGASGGVAELEGTTGGHADQSSRVQAVIDFCGPTDLVGIGLKGRISALVGGDEAKLRSATVQTHLDPGDPPVLICQGLNDRVVPPEQSRALSRALRQHGIPHELHLLEGVSHGIPVDGPLLLRFLDRTIGPSSPLALGDALDRALR